MEPGNIVEYIDRQRIFCAVVLEIRNNRLRLLTENNREVKVSANRLSHKSRVSVDMSAPRDRMVESLKNAAGIRKTIAEQIDTEELWEILHSEQEWIDLETMTELCFPDNPTPDHESAVIRSFFKNRIHFKFDVDKFFPYTEEHVEKMAAMAAEEARKKLVVDYGSAWLKGVLNGRNDKDESEAEYVEILKSVYLFEKESPHYDVGRAIMDKAGLKNTNGLFEALVNIGVWDADENVDMLKQEIPVVFPDEVVQYAFHLTGSVPPPKANGNRRDLTGLDLITIDGQNTLDYDDALSIERMGDGYRLGVHIADVGYYVKKGDRIDAEALNRGSSIYMPDRKIPMLPPEFAEGICSLRAEELRPAISVMINLTPKGDITGSEIFPSLIAVRRQLTYYDVSQIAEENEDIALLHAIGKAFRKKRMEDGAVQITLPEINIWFDESNELVVSKINRESPGRLLVSELMIMANWLMARFLAENGVPAIFRSQPDPRSRLYREDGGSLFQNWMQRKFLSRFILSAEPDRHSGLGLDAYVTATSPIRKYFDLMTQRQISSVFGLNEPYTSDEVEHAIHVLEQSLRDVSRLQNMRKRYWLFKYLERKVGTREAAIVLNKRKNNYVALLPEYLVECEVPMSNGIKLKPEDVIRVTIQNVNARKDVLSVFMG